MSECCRLTSSILTEWDGEGNFPCSCKSSTYGGKDFEVGGTRKFLRHSAGFGIEVIEIEKA